MKHLSLKQKLLSICLTISLFAPLVGYVAYHFTHQAFNQYDQIATVSFPNLKILSETKSSAEKIIGNLWELSYAKDASHNAKTRATIEKSLNTIKMNQQQYLEVPFVEGEQDLYDLVATSWVPLMNKINRLKEAPADQIATDMTSSEFKEQLTSFETSLDNLMHFQSNVSDSRMLLAKEFRTKTMTSVVTVTILSVLAAGLIGYYSAHKISNLLKEISENLAQSGEEVSAAAAKIKTSSEQLSQANAEQAASLEETAASIEEMNSMIKKNSENAKESSRMSANSQEKAETGKKVVHKMISAIKEIDDSNNKIMTQIREGNKRIEEIVKVISDIGEKTKVINDIVFQTKLLSFNASVEAARAGDDGKGFAVVAEEVGNLAQMSGNASKEISDMLEKSLHKVSSIVTETNESVQVLVDQGKIKVNEGSSIAKECAVVLEDIVTSIVRVAQMSHDISSASMEQSQGVQEITKAVHQLDEVTQNNAATSEESATAAEQLAHQSNSLRSVVDKLVMTIEGKVHAKSANHHNVVKLERRAAPKNVPVRPLKKAAGAEPSHNDPRFEEA